jgi:cell division protein FtsQ
MIGDRSRRGQKPSPARKIVQRRREVVGEHQSRAIITRARGVVEPNMVRADRSSRQRRGLHIATRVKVAVVAVAVLAVIAAGATWTYESPLLRVGSVQVEGTSQIPAETIVEKANLLGASMFTADLSGAQQALYRMPLVASVQVERAWPDSVKIVIKERQPWGTWDQGGVHYTIDREGVVLALGGAPEGSAVIKSSEPGSRVQGDRVDYQAVDAAAEIYAKLPQALGTTVMEVAFVAGKGVQVTTADGQTAMFGDSSSIAYKLAVWAALAKQARVERINYTTIDLRFGNRPVLQ